MQIYHPLIHSRLSLTLSLHIHPALHQAASTSTYQLSNTGTNYIGALPKHCAQPNLEEQKLNLDIQLDVDGEALLIIDDYQAAGVMQVNQYSNTSTSAQLAVSQDLLEGPNLMSLAHLISSSDVTLDNIGMPVPILNSETEINYAHEQLEQLAATYNCSTPAASTESLIEEVVDAKLLYASEPASNNNVPALASAADDNNLYIKPCSYGLLESSCLELMAVDHVNEDATVLPQLALTLDELAEAHLPSYTLAAAADDTNIDIKPYCSLYNGVLLQSSLPDQLMAVHDVGHDATQLPVSLTLDELAAEAHLPNSYTLDSSLTRVDELAAWDDGDFI
ncbi:hypothetical protein L7F22_048715, partial [Adiantum nelumboides]|nr:hypothetical protein [Adiantum nelumboides]